MEVFELSITNIINLLASSSGLMLALVGLILAFRSRFMYSWGRSFFIVFFSLLSLYAAFDLADLLSYSFTKTAGTSLSQLFLFLSSLFSSMLMPMIAILMLHLSDEQLRGSRLLRIVIPVWVIYAVLLVITQFTTFIYYYDNNNVYHRGPYYPLLLAPPVAIMIIIFIALLNRRDRLTKRQFRAFLVYILLPLACMLIQMQFSGVPIIVLGTSVAAFVMFYNVSGEQLMISMQQREENAKLLADNRVLQMRPHFIYNTLMSIYYLCGQDPEKAQEVILDFSSYLRKNFTAIATENLIPFTDELEHTRAYLAVEEARFEDLLSVEFDTPFINFRLPTLTLQPVVENAVKHGMDPESDPLHIKVMTRETDRDHLVIVEDNGEGFSDDQDAQAVNTAAAADGEGAHIAISNIRERLESSCGGSLDISAREGGGTIVTIKIPK